MASENGSESANEVTLDDLAQTMSRSPERVISEAIPTLKQWYCREDSSLQDLKTLVEILSQMGETHPEAVRDEYWKVKNELDDKMREMFDQYWGWSREKDKPFGKEDKPVGKDEKSTESKSVSGERRGDDGNVDALVSRYYNIIDSQRTLTILLNSGSLSKSDGEVTDEDIERFGKDYGYPILFKQIAERIARAKDVLFNSIRYNGINKLNKSDKKHMIEKIGGINYIPQEHIYEVINYIGKDLDEGELELDDLLWENGPSPNPMEDSVDSIEGNADELIQRFPYTFDERILRTLANKGEISTDENDPSTYKGVEEFIAKYRSPIFLRSIAQTVSEKANISFNCLSGPGYQKVRKDERINVMCFGKKLFVPESQVEYVVEDLCLKNSSKEFISEIAGEIYCDAYAQHSETSG